MTELLEAALGYAGRGWKILPLHGLRGDGTCTCTPAGEPCKEDERSAGKHPHTTNGVHDATDDDEQIEDWWSRWPRANVGIACGDPSGLAVLDVDDPDAMTDGVHGDPTLAKDVITARSGRRRGRHFYFARGNADNTTLPGGQLQSTGKYVVAPPSRHHTGNRYAWITAPDEGTLRPVPDWVATGDATAGRGQPATGADDEVPAQIPVGSRHPTLMREIARLRALGYGRDATTEAALALNDTQTAEPKPDDEIRDMVEWAYNREGQDLTPEPVDPEDYDEDPSEYEGALPGPINMGEGKTLKERGGDIVMRKKGETIPVIAKPFKLKRRIVLPDGEPLLHVDAGQEVIGTFDEVYRWLRDHGKVLRSYYGRDVLAHIARVVTREADGYPAWGAYATDEAEILIPPVDDVHPRHGAQRLIRDGITSTTRPTDDPGFDEYAELTEFFHAQEIWPLRGLSAMAPLAHVLRSHGIVVPGAITYSYEPQTGKTTLCRAFSTGAWGVPAETGEALSSEFRFAAYLDSGGVPLLLDEAEGLDWDRFAPLLKSALAGPTVTTRGRQDQSVERYASRAVPFFTTNAISKLPQPVLDRLLVVPFDDDHADTDPGRGAALDDLVWDLPPVGPVLADELRRRWPTSEDLVDDIRQAADDLLEATLRDLSRRRALSYAVILTGLDVWEAASEGTLPTPDVDTFVDRVVDPLERAATDRTADRLDRLRRWFRRWRSRETVRKEEHHMGRGQDPETTRDVRGEGELWATAYVNLEADQDDERDRVSGYLITTALLDEYNGDRSTPAAQRFDTLKELQRAVCRRWGIPASEVWEDGEDGSSVRRYRSEFDARRRAAWIPQGDLDSSGD